MDSPQAQLADRLKSANNILVTVSRNPSVDQLAACLGLTLLLNKMGKHSVSVFSGQVPSTIEFLKPEETIEKTTDSLRDFIIALDKDKADKLRYKVEDNMVRIFITPYKTSISEKDLEFSQGDFNVDVVVALGVKQQEDLDQAITMHGRILHDATVASINLSPDAGLGTINWHDQHASSLSELVTELADVLGENLLDNQIATALLTGIVAETDRFSNDKTSSQTMNASSVLMAAGANQQLVATKLEESPKAKPQPAAQDDQASDADQGEEQAEKSADGTLTIAHEKTDKDADDTSPESHDAHDTNEKGGTNAAPAAELPMPQPPVPSPPEQGLEPPALLSSAPPSPLQQQPPASPSGLQSGSKLITEPPSMGGALSANTKPEGLDPVTDPMSMPQAEPDKLLSRAPSSTASASPASPPSLSMSTSASSSAPGSSVAPTPAVTDAAGDTDKPRTLSDIEESVHSPHVDPAQLDSARDEVNQALQGSASPAPTPIQALNAQPLGGKLHPDGPPPSIQPPSSPVLPFNGTPPESSDTNPQPAPSSDTLSPSPQINDPTKAPPVPPPLPSETVKNATGNPLSPPPAL